MPAFENGSGARLLQLAKVLNVCRDGRCAVRHRGDRMWSVGSATLRLSCIREPILPKQALLDRCAQVLPTEQLVHASRRKRCNWTPQDAVGEEQPSRGRSSIESVRAIWLRIRWVDDGCVPRRVTGREVFDGVAGITSELLCRTGRIRGRKASLVQPGHGWAAGLFHHRKDRT